MQLGILFRKYIDRWLVKGDPIDAQRKLVSTIQKLVGIHNVTGDGNRENFSGLSVLAMLVFGGSFIYVGSFSQLVYLVQVFPDKMECFKVINCVSATSVPLSKYIFMWAARSRLKTIFNMSREGLLSIPEGSAALSKMLDTLSTAQYACWLVVVNQAATHVLYLMMPLMFTLFGSERYLPTTPGDSYGLSPKYESPFFEITFALTSTATAFSAINQTGYIVLFVILLAHELGHFYAITETFNEISQILKDKSHVQLAEDVNKKLRFCLEHHQFLLIYHQNIRELYKKIFGAHFLMTTIVLVSTLHTMNEWDIRNTILTAATGILPLFIYCFGGELLISAGWEMSVSAYACGWEMMEAKQARMVLLLLSMSQRPLCLTAADIFVMNRETFGNVAQVVYKVYAVFN